MTTRALACNPIDFVLAAGTVRVPQDFISMLNFSLIDFWVNEEVVRAAEGNRGPTRITFAEQFDKFIRSEVGEAN